MRFSNIISIVQPIHRREFVARLFSLGPGTHLVIPSVYIESPYKQSVVDSKGIPLLLGGPKREAFSTPPYSFLSMLLVS
tara:strand:- start:517 stop:753 length:237 start_codon:yes stop_codon:yes gene_type:complete